MSIVFHGHCNMKATRSCPITAEKRTTQTETLWQSNEIDYLIDQCSEILFIASARAKKQFLRYRYKPTSWVTPYHCLLYKHALLTFYQNDTVIIDIYRIIAQNIINREKGTECRDHYIIIITQININCIVAVWMHNSWTITCSSGRNKCLMIELHNLGIHYSYNHWDGLNTSCLLQHIWSGRLPSPIIIPWHFTQLTYLKRF